MPAHAYSINDLDVLVVLQSDFSFRAEIKRDGYVLAVLQGDPAQADFVISHDHAIELHFAGQMLLVPSLDHARLIADLLGINPPSA